MFKRLLILVPVFLVVFSFSVHAQSNRMYHITVSQVEYDKATLITPLVVVFGEYDLRFNTKNLEGTYLMEFDADYLQFDNGISRLFVNPASLTIVQVRNGVWSEVIRIGFDGKDHPLDLDFSWQTVYVIESYPNGEVHNAWYSKIVDKNYGYRWKSVARRRVK